MKKLENILVQNFKDRKLNHHEVDWIADYRKSAMDIVQELGIPELSNEDWRFTNLKDFSLKDFSPLSNGKSEFKQPNLPDYISKIDGYFIYMHNGQLIPSLDYPFTVQSLESSFEDLEVKKVLLDNTLTKNKDFFYELGSAFIEHGLFLKVDKSKNIDKPIVIINSFDSQLDNKFLNTRNIFFFGESSSAEIIEYTVSDSDKEFFLNKTTTVQIEKNSNVEHLLVESSNKSSYIFSNLKIISIPTERQEEGIAYSSRNENLSKKQLQEFIDFHNSAIQFTKSFDKKIQIKEANTLAKNFITNLVDQEFDYFEFRNANSLEIEGDISDARLFYAIYKGQTRLIDNIEL